MKKEEVVFNTGARADSLYYVADGAVALPGLNATVGSGRIIGETGVFSPDRERMTTAVCETDSEIYSLNAEVLRKLCPPAPRLTSHEVRDLSLCQVRIRHSAPGPGSTAG